MVVSGAITRSGCRGSHRGSRRQNSIWQGPPSSADGGRGLVSHGFPRPDDDLAADEAQQPQLSKGLQLDDRRAVGVLQASWPGELVRYQFQ